MPRARWLALNRLVQVEMLASVNGADHQQIAAFFEVAEEKVVTSGREILYGWDRKSNQWVILVAEDGEVIPFVNADSGWQQSLALIGIRWPIQVYRRSPTF